MHSSNYLLFVLTSLLLLSECKEVPTFGNPGVHDPESPDYEVPAIKEFRIIKNHTSNSAYAFIKISKAFPYTAIDISVKDHGEPGDFKTYQTITPASALNDSVHYFKMNSIPYINNEFSATLYYDSDYGRKQSEPVTATLKQHLFNFTITEGSNTLFWQSNFLINGTVAVLHQKGEQRPDTLSIDNLTTASGNGSINTGSISNEDKFSYQVDIWRDGVLTTEIVPIELERTNDCIEEIDGENFFLPPRLFSKSENTSSSKLIEYDWEGNCEVEELYIYRDDGGVADPANQIYPYVEVHSIESGSGPINYFSSYNRQRIHNQFWLIARINGELTERTNPFILYF